MANLMTPTVNQPPGTDYELGEDGLCKLPEERLNNMIRWTAFFYNAMQGFGKLALVWATVVLLGGFAVLIKPIDFWFSTVIVFIEAASIFSNSEKPEEQFFLRAIKSFESRRYGRLYEGIIRTTFYFHTSLGTVDGEADPLSSLASTVSSCRYFMIGIFHDHSYEQLAAAVVCTVLSAIRLIQQDYVHPRYRNAADHMNIQASMNIFYSLALAQSLSYFLMTTFASPVKRIVTICSKNKLGLWGIAVLYRYVKDTYMKCINGEARDQSDHHMSLVTFAMGLVNNPDSDGDQQMGVRMLDSLLELPVYKQRVLARLGSSTETVRTVISMLGFKSPWEQEARMHAASVMLRLSPHISLDSFSGMPQLISLLLMPNKRWSSGTFFYPRAVKSELTKLGIKIVDELVNDLDNLKKVKDTDQLLSRIIDLTNITGYGAAFTTATRNEIVATALLVLHKLVCMTGKTGRVTRRDLTENVNILRNIRVVLENPECTTEQLVPALGILACLAADEMARKDLGSLRQIIKKLVCFLYDPVEPTQVRPNYITRSQAAAEALYIISINNQSKISTILEEIKPRGIESLVDMLLMSSTKHSTPIANLMQNLRAYGGPDCTDVLKKLDEALSEVFKEIMQIVDRFDGQSSNGVAAHAMEVDIAEEEGKRLESLIGLSVQICTYARAVDFANVLHTANISAEILALKLKKILEVYNSPTTEFPGIRRYTVQLITCMMEKNSDYIEVLRTNGIDETIEGVAEAPMRLESFKLCSYGIGVFKHDVHISDVAKKSLEKMRGN